MNPTALRARDTARRKNARRATMTGAVALALGISFGWILGRTGGLSLPDRYAPVHVTTSTGRAHTAYIGEDGKFHSVETGETIAQVVKWSKP